MLVFSCGMIYLFVVLFRPEHKKWSKMASDLMMEETHLDKIRRAVTSAMFLSFEVPAPFFQREQDEFMVGTISFMILGCGLLVLAMYMNGEIPVKMGKHAVFGVRTTNARLAWLVQESPSFFVPMWLIRKAYISGVYPGFCQSLIVGLFVLHYFNRSFVYPYLMHNSSTPVAIRSMFFAFCFTFFNGFAIAKYELLYGNLPENWVCSKHFMGGIVMWLGGFYVNIHSDGVLRKLRWAKAGGTLSESFYKIPRGGVFEYVSGANFFGEIMEWWGLALASNFHLPLLCFAASTSMVVGTRALNHHRDVGQANIFRRIFDYLTLWEDRREKTFMQRYVQPPAPAEIALASFAAATGATGTFIMDMARNAFGAMKKDEKKLLPVSLKLKKRKKGYHRKKARKAIQGGLRRVAGTAEATATTSHKAYRAVTEPYKFFMGDSDSD